MSQTTERTETLRTSRSAIKIINQAAMRRLGVVLRELVAEGRLPRSGGVQPIGRESDGRPRSPQVPERQRHALSMSVREHLLRRLAHRPAAWSRRIVVSHNPHRTKDTP